MTLNCFKQDYEDLKNDVLIKDNENDGLKTDLKNLMEENFKLQDEVKILKEINMSLIAKIKKNDVQRELISKEIHLNPENKSLIFKNKNHFKNNMAMVVRIIILIFFILQINFS